MNYYIAYKFSGADKELLRMELESIAAVLERQGNAVYMTFRDQQQWGKITVELEHLLRNTLHAIDKCDAFLAYVSSGELSEGMLLEAGYAKAKGKKIVLAIRKDLNLKFLRVLADDIIEFSSTKDLLLSLKETTQKS